MVTTEGMEDTIADMEDTMVGTIMRVMVVIITGVTVTMEEEATEATTEAMVITGVEAMADIMGAMAVTTEGTDTILVVLVLAMVVDDTDTSHSDTNIGEQRWGPMLRLV